MMMISLFWIRCGIKDPGLVDTILKFDHLWKKGNQMCVTESGYYTSEPDPGFEGSETKIPLELEAIELYWIFIRLF